MKKDYIEKTLKNGVKVYIYSDKNCKRTFVSYNVKYGTLGYFDKFYYMDKKYEVVPAIAHFLEHYLIEKSKRGNMFHHFMDKNYECNGVTYPEVTSYYFIGIKDIEKSIEELITMVDDPVFTEENIKEVKSAICEELKSAQDNKYRIAFTNNKRNVYANFDASPKSNNVLGTVESTAKISLEDAKICYDAYYNDENKFLVIGGNVDVDKTIELLEKIYSNIPAHPNQIRPLDYEDKFEVRKKCEVIYMPMDSDFVILTYKIKNDFKIDNLKLDLCVYIFNRVKFNGSTKFVEDLTKDKVVIGGIGLSDDFFLDSITISYSTESYNSDAFLEAMAKEIKVMDIKEKDFELAKKRLIVNELKSRDYIYSCFQRFATQLDFTKSISEIDTIKNLSFDEFKDIMSKFKFDLNTVTILKNKK